MREHYIHDGTAPASKAMIGAVPVNEARYAVCNRRRRSETDITHKIVNVRVGRGHVAGLHGQQFSGTVKIGRHDEMKSAPNCRL